MNLGSSEYVAVLDLKVVTTAGFGSIERHVSIVQHIKE
jgi:hypothetical protein